VYILLRTWTQEVQSHDPSAQKCVRKVVEKPERKRLLRRTKHGREINATIHLKQAQLYNEEWINLTQAGTRKEFV
jgi:hypothetical protein